MTFYGANSEVWNSLLVTFYNSKIEIIIGSIINKETKLSKEMGETEDVEKKKNPVYKKIFDYETRNLI